VLMLRKLVVVRALLIRSRPNIRSFAIKHERGSDSGKKRTAEAPTQLINEKIRAEKVRLIDAQGQQLGVMALREAIKLAKSQNLDIMQIHARDPVVLVRMVNVRLQREAQHQRDKQLKEAKKQTIFKEFTLKPRIDPHDLQNKIKQMSSKLTSGFSVRVVLQSAPADQPQHPPNRLQMIADELQEVGVFQKSDGVEEATIRPRKSKPQPIPGRPTASMPVNSS